MPLHTRSISYPHTVRAAIISIVMLTILILPAATGQQRPGIGAEARLRNRDWTVIQVDYESVADQSGLKLGDVVIAIDGMEPSVLRHTDPGLDLGAARAWTVLRSGEILTIRPDPTRIPWHIRAEPVLMLVIALIFWAVATFVRVRKPGDQLAHQFYWLNLVIALALALTPATANDVVWAKIVSVTAFAVLPALFLSFFLFFGRGAPPNGRDALLVRGLYVGGMAIGGLYLGSGLAKSELYDPVRVVMLITLAIGFLGGLYALATGYARPPSLHTRRQIQVVLLGTAVAILPITAASLLPESFGLRPIVRPHVASLSIVFLPLSFSYAILRRRLLEIDVVVERTLVYGIMTLFLAGCYALFLNALDFAGRDREVNFHPVFSLAFFAIVTLTFITVRDRVRWLIDHLIYRDRYDYVQTLRTLGAQLASIRPIDQVLATVVENLAGAMNLRGAAVLLQQPEGGLAIRAACGEYRDDELAQSLLDRAPRWRREDLGASTTGWWVPLVAHGVESGLLYLGPKRLNAEFSGEDLSLAETIATQAAVAIANALLIERLQTKVAELELLRDRLLHVQEEERKHLAQELHDGALHTVLGLVRLADATAEARPSDRAAHDLLSERLQLLAERGRDAVYELRAVCTDLYPSELAHLGLVAALEDLARRTSRDENVLVRLSAATFPERCRLPDEIESALYRIAREAIDNVCRHADAEEVKIELGIEWNNVVLAIRDDGRGFVVPASFGALLRNGHLGLATMRERIERLGGEFVVDSTPGVGTEVRVGIAIPDRLRAYFAVPLDVRE